MIHRCWRISGRDFISAVKFIIKSLTKTIFELNANVVGHIYLDSGREWYRKERVESLCPVSQ